MYETPLTVVGKIVTAPAMRRVGDRAVVNFRLASNTRRRNTEGDWESGSSFFLNVSCWGKLATGVAASLGKGDLVVVAGDVYTNEYDDREGIRRSSTELRARAVGPNLAHYVVKVSRVVENEQSDTDDAAADSGFGGAESAETASMTDVGDLLEPSPAPV